MSLRPTPPRALRGYAPLAALVVAVAAFTTLVPTTGNEILATSTRTRGGGTIVAGGSDPGDTTVTTGAGGVASGGTATPGQRGITAPVAGCADRKLQIPAFEYSPPCVAFSGNNGGATTKGVTADTIKVTWRLAADNGTAGAVQSAAGDGIDITDSKEDIVRTIEGITEFINKNFQLYGRKIDIDVFDGRGVGADEVQGAGQDGANADAVTVADQKAAFMDASAGTAPYTDALARRKVVSIGVNYLSEEWYTERHPYVWTGVSCTQTVRMLAEYANKRLYGGTADHAGEGLRGKPRKIAVIAPENSYYQDCVRTLAADLAKEGNKLAAELSYALDINTISQDSSSIIARLSADNITSVLMVTDPVSPLFFSSKATQQRYNPEWILAGTAATDTDVVAQQYDQEQWAHCFGFRTFFAGKSREQSDAYAAFKLARPSEEPAGLALYGIYQRLLQMAIGIQQAGPNLTPATFGAGMQGYDGGSGFYGAMRGRPGLHTLQTDAEEVYYDPKAISSFNRAAGAYVPSTPKYELGQWPREKPKVKS